MDRGTWQGTVLGAQRRTGQSTHTVGSLSLIITHSSSSTNISVYRKMIRYHNINIHTISFKLELDTCQKNCPEQQILAELMKCSAMAPHSSTLAWKIPWTEEPCRLQSMGSLRVGHSWATSLSLFTFMHWRRKWQPTPVFLPGESQGQRSLVGCCLWGHTESDTTEAT